MSRVLPTPASPRTSTELRLLLGHGVVEHCNQLLQLARAPDEDVLGRQRAHSVGPRRDEAVRRHRLRLALQRQRLDRLDVDRVGDELVGQLAEQRLRVARRLLEPRGDVDGVARHQPLVRRAVTRDDAAGVDADAVRERDAVGALEFDVQILQLELHRLGGADRSERIILVHLRQPEDGHHGVADVLLDGAAVADDRSAHHVEVASHHLAQRLGIERLAEGGRALQVAEEDRDELPGLLRRRSRLQRRPAVAAQPKLGWIFLTAV